MIALLATLLLTNLTEVACTDRSDVRFDLEGTISLVCRGHFALANDEQALYIINRTKMPRIPLRPGDYVRCLGKTIRKRGERLVPGCSKIRILGRRPVPAPLAATMKDVVSGRFDAHLVRLSCTVGECFFDEVDSGYGFTELEDGNSSVFVAWENSPENLEKFNRLRGADISVVGVPTLNAGYLRKHMGRMLANDESNYPIKILRMPTRQAFDVPDIKTVTRSEPCEIARAGRRRASGTVLAVRRRGQVFLQTDEDEILAVELATKDFPPVNGRVDVVGIVASDLFRLNLLRAEWQPSSARTAPPSVDPQSHSNVTLRQVFSNDQKRLRYNVRLLYRPIRIRAAVKTISTVSDDTIRIYLQNEGHLLAVEPGFNCTLPRDLEPGCVIEASGIAVAESNSWSPNTPFPQIHDIVLVTRTTDDIVIVRHPPWWTPQRLFVCVLFLLATLVGIVLWNLALRRTVRRRERELKSEILVHVESKMKMRERTQLAIELHDTLSQGLTGVSMELNTAETLIGDRGRLSLHLERASRSLKSCRDELKSCLWDLRSNALSLSDVNEAVRRTLLPVISDCGLTTRFSVQREKLADKYAQALLRIVRELAVNAVRHGRATQLTIAGCVEDDWLKFSVKDNGTGFDPARAPGIAQGHFGLQGIRERVKRFDGTFEITSEPGRGTKAAVRFRVTDELEEQP